MSWTSPMTVIGRFRFGDTRFWLSSEYVVDMGSE